MRARKCGGGMMMPGMRAANGTFLGAGAQRFFDDLVDGAGAAAALCAAAEAAIDLLRRTRQIPRGAHRATDIFIAQNVAGTDDQGGQLSFCTALSLLRRPARCKRKRPNFKVFQTGAVKASKSGLVLKKAFPQAPISRSSAFHLSNAHRHRTQITCMGRRDDCEARTFAGRVEAPRTRRFRRSPAHAVAHADDGHQRHASARPGPGAESPCASPTPGQLRSTNAIRPGIPSIMPAPILCIPGRRHDQRPASCRFSRSAHPNVNLTAACGH